ncbi:MAG: SGNH/GDSL hydrolase family protein [Clostridium lundense]|nr:SGNH/GDSL hydrolase family protein [Clostridium lundense]
MNNFNVVFLGGSITEGAGASKYTNSFTYNIEDYIKQKYKDKNVSVFNEGISGTGSQFGLFRLKRDVASKDPDIVFIEFAVNDRIVDSNSVLITAEGLIRELLKLSKAPAIIFLITPTELEDACGDLHKRIADYYNISCIDIQNYVWNNIRRNKYRWNEISIDNLHPNDKGHDIYGDYIISVLENNDGILFNKPILRENILTGFEFKNPRLISYEEAIFYGHWKEENINIKGKMNIAAVSDMIGDCIEIYFNGNYFAITTLLTRNSGILEIEIDGATGSIDLYSNTDPYFTCVLNIDNLAEGTHRAVLRVSERKNINSVGNRIVIGEFLVDDN